MARLGGDVVAVAGCFLAACSSTPRPAPPLSPAPSAVVSAVAAPAEPPSSEAAIARSAWLSAGNVPSVGAARAAGACFSDVGCGRAVAALPSCDAELLPRDVAALVPEQELGKRVLVSGRLLVDNETASQLLLCDGCCSPVRVPLRLAPTMGEFPALPLADVSGRDAFSCQADASETCCGLDVPVTSEAGGNSVAVYGKVSRQAGEPKLFQLDDPKLCSLGGHVAVPSSAAQAHCAAGQDSEAQPFPDGDAQCGCSAGGASCRRGEPNACFLRDRWFADGVSVPGSSSCLERHCQQGSWVWQGELCTARPTRLSFAPGRAELDAEQRALLATTAQKLSTMTSGLTLEAFSATSEPGGAELEGRRVAFVKAVLQAAGVAAPRVRVQKRAAGSNVGAAGARIELKLMAGG